MTGDHDGQHPRDQHHLPDGLHDGEKSAEPVKPPQRPAHRFTRNELIFGLRDVINKLKVAGVPATIRIIGGAAISMLYWSERGATQDIDAELGPEDIILTAATRTAVENGWPSDWLNTKATMFFPNGFGPRRVEWVTVHDKDGIVVEIATAETLLAMKLNSAIARGRREISDLALLLGLCGIDNVEDAEAHFHDYYGEDLNDRAIKMVQASLVFDTSHMTADELDLETD